MKNKLTAIATALLLTAGTGLLLTGPAEASAPPRRGVEIVVISGAGLNGSQVRTIVYYMGGVARCVVVYEKPAGEFLAHQIANTCPQPRTR